MQANSHNSSQSSTVNTVFTAEHIVSGSWKDFQDQTPSTGISQYNSQIVQNTRGSWDETQAIFSTLSPSSLVHYPLYFVQCSSRSEIVQGRSTALGALRCRELQFSPSPISSEVRNAMAEVDYDKLSQKEQQEFSDPDNVISLLATVLIWDIPSFVLIGFWIQTLSSCQLTMLFEGLPQYS